MFIINWGHDEFRIEVSELNVSVTELKQYFDAKGVKFNCESNDE